MRSLRLNKELSMGNIRDQVKPAPNPDQLTIYDLPRLIQSVPLPEGVIELKIPEPPEDIVA